MRYLRVIVLCIVLSVLPWAEALAAAVPGTPFERAQIQQLCSWVAVSTYDSRINALAREELAAAGWKVKKFNETTEDAEAKFYIVSRELPGQAPMYILAITGTQSLKDVKVDLNLRKVFFGGKTQAEFFSAAQRSDVTAKDPMVHKGFNDYTNTAFFTRVIDGRTFGERLRDELKTHPDAKLFLTGHSLGGAVATLLGTRLMALGVPSNQLEIITFGAPAVGNAAFARAYGDALPLDRVVIDGDPIKMILQSLPHGYAQFGATTEWARNENSDHLHHEMFVYADAAVRNFYDQKAAAEKRGEDTTTYHAEPPVQSAVYVMPMTIAVDKKIRNDLPYMKLILRDALKNRLSGVVFSERSQETLAEACEAAQKAGCHYILREDFTGKRRKDENYNFLMSMQEEIYDTDGRTLSVQDANTDTRLITPLEAFLYDQTLMRERREQLLVKKDIPQPKLQLEGMKETAATAKNPVEEQGKINNETH